MANDLSCKNVLSVLALERGPGAAWLSFWSCDPHVSARDLKQISFSYGSGAVENTGCAMRSSPLAENFHRRTLGFGIQFLGQAVVRDLYGFAHLLYSVRSCWQAESKSSLGLPMADERSFERAEGGTRLAHYRGSSDRFHGTVGRLAGAKSGPSGWKVREVGVASFLGAS